MRGILRDAWVALVDIVVAAGGFIFSTLGVLAIASLLILSIADSGIGAVVAILGFIIIGIAGTVWERRLNEVVWK